MSKVGKLPIEIPAGVTVHVDGQKVTVKGPKGELSHVCVDQVTVSVQENQILTAIQHTDDKKYRWLTRTLIANMVAGVVTPFEKKLSVIGVGYDAKVQGNDLMLQLGFSHPIKFPIPANTSMTADKDAKGNPIVTIHSIDKQLVGEVAAKIRDMRKPEPYKGKGVRYFGEKIKLKAGKSSKK